MSKTIYKNLVDRVWIGSKEIDLTTADQNTLKIVNKHCPDLVIKTENKKKVK